MKKSLFIANWKMNKTQQEAQNFVDVLTHTPALFDKGEILIAAPFTLLPLLFTAVQQTPIQLAAQNMFYEESGAFTGEISPIHVQDAGCTHVIIGHSERRHVFLEDNTLLNKKNHAAAKHKLIAIYCIGETLEERKCGDAKTVVREQLQAGLESLSLPYIEQMIIAYEPVWAIGTGETATPEHAEKMHAFIRTLLPQKTRIVYGGSVNEKNAHALLQKPSIDGVLVGGASVDPHQFITLITSTHGQ
ncbi:MAG TPA: triose-phosphate isomerase [Patescibacteria group bacterium]|nr:triose-phosphate isomerase [Patescibacteria group bacterium]